MTKYGLETPLSDTSAEKVAKAVADNFIVIYGAPMALESDMDSNFMS